MRLAVLVPSYKRVADLERCLGALALQDRPADRVVLVARFDDTDTLAVVPYWSTRLALTLVEVRQPGVVGALNAGLAAVEEDAVAITDDDAAPRKDWLARIERHFLSDATIDGVGGRDYVHQEPPIGDQTTDLVGRIMWFGRLVGNHHIGVGPVRDVELLKGVNMSYRKRAIDGIQFDVNLRGRGAQVWNEMAFCLELGRRGRRLIYDPEVAVDHYPAKRFDYDQRNAFHVQAIEDAAFNQYWALLHSMPDGPQKLMTCGWQRVVGTSGQPGLLHLVKGALRRDPNVLIRWKAAHRGRSAARQTRPESSPR